MNFLSNIVLFRLKSLISFCSAISLGSKAHITTLCGDPVGAGVRPRSWRPEHPGPVSGDMGLRAGAAGGEPGGPGTPDGTDASSPETGADRLPFRVRPPRRRGPGPSGIAARGRVILSDRDLAVIAKAVARARQEGKNDRQSAAAGLPGPGPGPPPEAPRCSAAPPAMTRALPTAS